MMHATTGSRFVSNTAALGASTVLSTLFTLAQVKVLAAFLTQEMFGLFAALRGLSLLVSMIAANGLPQLLVRYLPFYEARGDAKRAAVLSAACVLGALGAAIVLIVGLRALRSTFLSSVPPGEMTATFELWFYATTVAVTLKLVFYGGLSGLRRMAAQTWIESISLLVQVAWIFAARDRLDLAVLFKILGTVSLASLAVTLPWYFRQLRRDIARIDAPAAGRGLERAPSYGSYWIGAAGLSVVAMAFTDVDRYILSSVLALELLSLFHIGGRVLRLANRLMSIPVLAFQPEVSRLDAEGRRGDVDLSTRVFLKFNLVTSIFLAAGVAAFAPEIIRLVANDAYLPARALLVILALSIPLTAMAAPLTAVMKALDQVRRAFYCDLSFALTYVAALVVLGRAFGLLGAGAAHVAACVVQLLLADRLSSIKLGASVLTVLTRILGACAVAYAPAVAASWLPLSQWARLGVRVALLAVGLWVFRRLLLSFGVLTEEERGRLMLIAGRSGLGRVSRRLLV